MILWYYLIYYYSYLIYVDICMMLFNIISYDLYYSDLFWYILQTMCFLDMMQTPRLGIHSSCNSNTYSSKSVKRRTWQNKSRHLQNKKSIKVNNTVDEYLLNFWGKIGGKVCTFVELEHATQWVLVVIILQTSASIQTWTSSSTIWSTGNDYLVI